MINKNFKSFFRTNKIVIKRHTFLVFFYLFFIFFCFSLSEYYFRYGTFKPDFQKLKQLFNYSDFCSFEDFNARNNFSTEKAVIKKTNKKSILLLGCSFAQGYNIPELKKPAQKLSDITGRSVYNFAYGGGGIQHNYRRITDNAYTNGINPEYIIYVFINQQINRMYRYQWGNDKTIEYLRYKETNGNFKRINPLFSYFWKFYTVKRIQEIIWSMKYSNSDNAFDDFVKMMLKIHEISKEKWPKSKFIILVFPDFIAPDDTDYFSNYDWNILKENGIKIVNTEDFIKLNENNKEILLAKDKVHPSEVYWGKILPLFVRKYNM